MAFIFASGIALMLVAPLLRYRKAAIALAVRTFIILALTVFGLQLLENAGGLARVRTLDQRIMSGQN